MSATRRQKSPTIETFTLILVGTDGLQFPIGPRGISEFHLFHDWTKAHGAIADVVAALGIANIHAIAVTKTQTYDGRMVDFSASHYTQNEVRDLAAGFLKPGPSVTLASGRRVNVSIPRPRRSPMQ